MLGEVVGVGGVVLCSVVADLSLSLARCYSDFYLLSPTLSLPPTDLVRGACSRTKCTRS